MVGEKIRNDLPKTQQMCFEKVVRKPKHASVGKSEKHEDSDAPDKL